MLYNPRAVPALSLHPRALWAVFLCFKATAKPSTAPVAALCKVQEFGSVDGLRDSLEAPWSGVKNWPDFESVIVIKWDWVMTQVMTIVQFIPHSISFLYSCGFSSYFNRWTIRCIRCRIHELDKTSSAFCECKGIRQPWANPLLGQVLRQVRGGELGPAMDENVRMPKGASIWAQLFQHLIPGWFTAIYGIWFPVNHPGINRKI